jgi:hypothetical protein
LKLAIARLNNDFKKIKEKSGDTFVTQIDNKHVDSQQIDALESTNLLETNSNTSKLDLGKTPANRSLNQSMIQSSVKRTRPISPISKYKNIQSQNIKFSSFLEMLFKSKLANDQIQKEIQDYVTAWETKQNYKFLDLRLKIDKERKKRIFDDSVKVNEATDKNELETVFVDCIEEVRKEIMRRRLKQEIVNKRKYQPYEDQTDEAKDFEESLLKLAQLARGKIKLSDFTSRDKFSLLDLFVNNEKTLLKIYEALFPHVSIHLNDDQKSQTFRTNNYQAVNTTSDTGEYGGNISIEELYSLPSNKNNKNVMVYEPKDMNSVSVYVLYHYREIELWLI